MELGHLKFARREFGHPECNEEPPVWQVISGIQATAILLLAFLTSGLLDAE